MSTEKIENFKRRNTNKTWYEQEEKHDTEKTASQKKLNNSTVISDNANSVTRNVILDSHLLNVFLSEQTVCAKCRNGTIQLTEDEQQRQGWSIKFKTTCTACDFESEFDTSTACDDGRRKINSQMVLAMRAIGKGRASARKFSAFMNMAAPLNSKSYANITRNLAATSKSVMEAKLQESAKSVREMKEIEMGPTEITDCGVTIDGSWLNRGMTSKHGFVSVISIDTGEVLDVHYMCSTCPQCSKWEDKTSRAFLEWFSVHEQHCKLNHDGSSQSMEAEGASVLFSRSVERKKLRYNPFIGDGDSKAFQRVQKEAPYGPAYAVRKEECVGHIQKRMGTRLRNMITRSKGIKLPDGKLLTGAGRLTLAMVDSFQVWYGRAIRENKGNPERMSQETLAILKHYSENADHSYCPIGSESWCKYQSDKVTGEKTYVPPSNPLAPAVIEHIKPVFDDLSNVNLLRNCANCFTQNQNESLHHTVWSFIPKDHHHSANEVECGIHIGILNFNSGLEKTAELLFEANDLTFTKQMSIQLQRLDNQRKYNSVLTSQASGKEKRKERRLKGKRKVDAFKHKEGVQYKSGQFYNKTSTTGAKKQRSCKKCGKPMKGHSRVTCS